jgi:hypothetical protein
VFAVVEQHVVGGFVQAALGAIHDCVGLGGIFVPDDPHFGPAGKRLYIGSQYGRFAAVPRGACIMDDRSVITIDTVMPVANPSHANVVASCHNKQAS